MEEVFDDMNSAISSMQTKQLERQTRRPPKKSPSKSKPKKEESSGGMDDDSLALIQRAKALAAAAQQFEAPDLSNLLKRAKAREASVSMEERPWIANKKRGPPSPRSPRIASSPRAKDPPSPVRVAREDISAAVSSLPHTSSPSSPARGKDMPAAAQAKKRIMAKKRAEAAKSVPDPEKEMLEQQRRANRAARAESERAQAAARLRARKAQEAKQRKDAIRRKEEEKRQVKERNAGRVAKLQEQTKARLRAKAREDEITRQNRLEEARAEFEERMAVEEQRRAMAHKLLEAEKERARETAARLEAKKKRLQAQKRREERDLKDRIAKVRAEKFEVAARVGARGPGGVKPDPIIAEGSPQRGRATDVPGGVVATEWAVKDGGGSVMTSGSRQHAPHNRNQSWIKPLRPGDTMSPRSAMMMTAGHAGAVPAGPVSPVSDYSRAQPSDAGRRFSPVQSPVRGPGSVAGFSTHKSPTRVSKPVGRSEPVSFHAGVKTGASARHLDAAGAAQARAAAAKGMSVGARAPAPSTLVALEPATGAGLVSSPLGQPSAGQPSSGRPTVQVGGLREVGSKKKAKDGEAFDLGDSPPPTPPDTPPHLAHRYDSLTSGPARVGGGGGGAQPTVAHRSPPQMKHRNKLSEQASPTRKEEQPRHGNGSGHTRGYQHRGRARRQKPVWKQDAIKVASRDEYEERHFKAAGRAPPGPAKKKHSRKKRDAPPDGEFVRYSQARDRLGPLPVASGASPPRDSKSAGATKQRTRSRDDMGRSKSFVEHRSLMGGNRADKVVSGAYSRAEEVAHATRSGFHVGHRVDKLSQGRGRW